MILSFNFTITFSGSIAKACKQTTKRWIRNKLQSTDKNCKITNYVIMELCMKIIHASDVKMMTKVKPSMKEVS